VPPEKDSERFDRELDELLQELRVALPGVQVLFAFLLTVPFSQGFTKMNELQRDVYFGTLLATALTSILFIAPTAYHRLRWRDYDKDRLLTTSTRLSIAGLVALAMAIGGAVFLIGDFMFGGGVAAVTTGAVAALLVWFWFGLPLARKLRDEDGKRSSR
jgi:phosphoglycerol transferase MdoB-like AlkP superfamily enzyme